MSLFVDSSIWYAAADRGEASNRRAKEILVAPEQLVTTDHVLVETWTLLCHRLSHEAAERFWLGLRAGVARVVAVGDGDLEQAWSIGETWPDQEFSLVDRTSFAVMLRLGINRAASLDDDFSVFRYGPGRKRAFEVVR